MKTMYELLIVEDEELLREHLAHAVDWTALGFVPLPPARDGLEALERMEAHAPDVVLTDIRMPRMDGLSLMESTRRLGLDVEFVLLSAFGDFAYAQKAIRHGVSAYLLKPLRMEECVSVFEALHRKLTQRRNTVVHALGPDGARQLEPLQQAFLAQILLRDMSAEYVLLRAQELKLALDARGYRVALIASEAIRQAATQRSEAAEAMLQAARAFFQGNGLYAAYVGDHIGVLACDLSAGRPQALPETLLAYRQAMQAQGIPIGTIYMGVSGVSDTIEGLHDLYRQALHALEYRWYGRRGNGVVSFAEIKHLLDNPTRGARLSTWIDQQTAGLTGMDEVSTRRLVDAFQDEMERVGLMGHEARCVKCLELYLAVDGVHRRHFVVEPFDSRAEEVFEGIRACNSAFDMAALLTQRLQENLAEYRKSAAASERGMSSLVKQYVKDHIESRIQLADVAAHVYLNPSYLSSTFKRENGISLSAYISQQKIEQAKEYLLHAPWSVQTIAERLAFSDYRYFCTVFKRETGVTPLEYRARGMEDVRGRPTAKR